MSKVKCDQCDEPRESFVGPEDAPMANFCREHGRALTKVSSKRRGAILESIVRKRAESDAWMRGFATALAESHRLLAGGNDSSGIRSVAAGANADISRFRKAGVSSYDLSELRRAGIK